MDLISTEDVHVGERPTLHLNGQAWGLAFGVVGGLGLFLATIVLVLKGGQNVGQNLGLLGGLLPGYRITIPGALIGFAYLFFIGYALGRLIGAVYNGIAAPRPRA